MTEKVQVIVEAKDAASGVLRGITSELGRMGGVTEQLTGTSINWGNVAAEAARFVAAQMKEAFNVATEYASSVRDLSLASGVGAEESSRLLQVLDDFEITAGDVTTATKALTKQGLAPTIDTLAMLSDQYLDLNTAEERNAFITNNLGRGGAKWANVLKEGSSAIREMGDGVNENLILNDEMIRQYEEMRLNQDEWNDNIQAIQVTLVNTFVPAINDTVSAFRTFSDAQTELEQKGLSAYEAHRLTMMGIQEAKTVTDSATVSYTAMAQAIQISGDVAAQVSEVNYKSLISSIMDMQRETDRYNETQMEANTAIDRANREYAEGKITLDERNKILQDNKIKLDANAEAHKQWSAQTVYSFAQARAAADGEITEGEGKVLIDMGVKLGLFDKQTADAMEAVNKSFDNVDTENAQEMIDALEQALIELTSDPWIIKIETDVPQLPTPTPDTFGSSTQTTGKNLTGGTLTGGNNYFYGNNTLVLANPGEFMEMR